jgi:hypothetical protein
MCFPVKPAMHFFSDGTERKIGFSRKPAFQIIEFRRSSRSGFTSPRRALLVNHTTWLSSSKKCIGRYLVKNRRMPVRGYWWIRYRLHMCRFPFFEVMFSLTHMRKITKQINYHNCIAILRALWLNLTPQGCTGFPEKKLCPKGEDPMFICSSVLKIVFTLWENFTSRANLHL